MPERQPVNFMFQFLYGKFLRGMARICVHATEKYGSVDQYCDGPLHGEKSPINHALDHIFKYLAGEPHDFLTNEDKNGHLIAAAYNLMMQYKYEQMGIAEPLNKVNNEFATLKSNKPITGMFPPTVIEMEKDGN